MARLTRAALAAGALVALPITAWAQPSAVTSADQHVVDNQTADRLFEQANRLKETRTHWPEAASLYARSAGLRSYGDIRALAAYQQAGHLYIGLNRPEKARQMFEKAAGRALEAGDPYQAILSYLAAAELVARHGARPANENAGIQHFELAMRLSESPLLTELQRTGIKARIRT